MAIRARASGGARFGAGVRDAGVLGRSRRRSGGWKPALDWRSAPGNHVASLVGSAAMREPTFDIRFVGSEWAHQAYEPPDAGGRRIPLQPIRCGELRCCGAFTRLGSRPTLFVAEPTPGEVRRAELERLAALHARMLDVHEAGHFVANRLHDRVVVRVSLVADEARLAYVENAERPAPVDELARAIDNITVARAGRHAAAHLLGWIADGGCEDDEAIVEHVRLQLALFHAEPATAMQRAEDAASERLAVLVEEHAVDVERVACAFERARGRVLEREELAPLAASITPRWSS